MLLSRVFSTLALTGLLIAPTYAKSLPNLPKTTLTQGVLQVGTLSLQRCVEGLAYCGQLNRPFDPAGEVAGSIPIRFEYYPRQDQAHPALGTIVAVEGGPGYPSTGSYLEYLTLFKPLLNHRNLLLVDNRGTGHSQVIDCVQLQTAPTLTVRNTGQCGQSLGNRADLYGTGLAADDLAAVLDTLQTGKVDLYGDSYGTYFGQTFAARHPDKLRSVVLDSAYQVPNSSPWYPFDAPTMRRAFNVTCERNSNCRNLPGTSIERITKLIDQIRVTPITGQAYDGNGDLKSVTLNAVSLSYLMSGNATGPVVFRELDAATRAYLAYGDTAPLLRLIAENNTIADSRDPARDPKYYSTGLFTAVSCTDYDQIYDMTAPPEVRYRQRNAAIARKMITDPEVYAPFTIAEYNQQPLDYSLLDLCLSWPVPSAAHPPTKPIPDGAQFTTAPTLVLSGELDSLTAPPDGRTTASFFPNGQQVLVANSFHVTAVFDRDHCAAEIVRRFVDTLSPGDTACAAKITEVRTVPTFATRLDQLPAATAITGNTGTTEDLQRVTAATLAAGDVVARWWMNQDYTGVGLRGGKFGYTSQGYVFHYALDHLAWIAGVEASGTLDWDYNTGLVTAQVKLSGSETPTGTLTIQWQDRQPQALATVTGTIGGRAIEAVMPAP